MEYYIRKYTTEVRNSSFLIERRYYYSYFIAHYFNYGSGDNYLIPTGCYDLNSYFICG